jgi:anti-anti-sigma regulatory factor
MGLLLLLAGHAREAGFSLSIEAVSPRLARVLTVNGLDASVAPSRPGADQVA